MKTRLLAFIPAALAAGAALPAHAAQTQMSCQPVTRAAVEAQFDRFNQAWATKNPDTVTSLFSRDAVLLPTISNQPRTDAAGIRDYFVEFLAGSPQARIDASKVKLGCNAAARLGTWSVTLNGTTASLRPSRAAIPSSTSTRMATGKSTTSTAPSIRNRCSRRQRATERPAGACAPRGRPAKSLSHLG